MTTTVDNDRLRALRMLYLWGVQWDGTGDMLALTFLVFAGLKPGMDYSQVEAPILTITQAMERMKRDWGVEYAPNTRETVRHNCVNRLLAANIIEANPDYERPKQSPNYCYQLEYDSLALMRLSGW